MGRNSPPLDDLRNENGIFRGNGASRSEKISNYLGRQSYDDGTECVGSSSSKKPLNSNVEGENYTEITMVPFERCPNREKSPVVAISLDNCAESVPLMGNAWTKEESKTPCRPVVPNVQEQFRNPFEMIANKKDRKVVANYLRSCATQFYMTTWGLLDKDEFEKQLEEREALLKQKEYNIKNTIESHLNEKYKATSKKDKGIGKLSSAFFQAKSKILRNLRKAIKALDDIIFAKHQMIIIFNNEIHFVAPNFINRTIKPTGHYEIKTALF
ncbi:hypothetical protein C1645_827113 [Glomus cerebriforme]|uniref:Uncharacterized protein n=1 Tax=Glomus cerebriforme TaxID=658196 RepID=A0A397SV21_9GLOM|nr:hypothetical protein C1645_827113 [Glomus cerebriforme]